MRVYRTPHEDAGYSDGVHTACGASRMDVTPKRQTRYDGPNRGAVGADAEGVRGFIGGVSIGIQEIGVDGGSRMRNTDRQDSITGEKITTDS